MNHRYASLLALLIVAPAIANHHENPKVDIHYHEHHKHTHHKEGLAAVGAIALQITERHPYLAALLPVAVIAGKIIKDSPDLQRRDTAPAVIAVVFVSWIAIGKCYRTFAQAIMQQCDIEPLRD